MLISAENVRSLQSYDLRILLAVENLMKRYEWVPLDIIKLTTDLSENEVNYRLGRLIAFDMIRFQKAPYNGYTLVFNGYDALALHTLSERNTISALGSLVGVGKESIIYEALGLSSVILKFHRVRQRSFQSVRITRGYLPDAGHIPRLFASSYSAEREFEVLKQLHPTVSVPLPIDLNRHVVVMSLIHGTQLNRVDLLEPKKIFDEIIGNVQRAYQKGIIHADLSEFNVMVEDRKCYLIDWPQWVGVDHPNASFILRRDLDNILIHFRRKYNIVQPVDDVVKEVTE